MHPPTSADGKNFSGMTICGSLAGWGESASIQNDSGCPKDLPG
jgi:hypothetical protein